MNDPRNRPAWQTSGSRRRRRGERGSAFTVALLVLVVLTISGLALTLMTQTEMRIGANERLANRTFYASDSGLAVPTARKLAIGPELTTYTFFLNTTQQDTGVANAPTTFSDQITVTPLIPIGMQNCNYTMINGPQQYVCITYAVNSSSGRTGISTGAKPITEIFSQKLLGTMINMQPQRNQDAFNPLQAQVPVQF